MARNKRKIENGLKNEVEAKKEEVIEDKDTKIGKNEKAVEVESEEDDGDSSDSSVYSELEEGKYLFEGETYITIFCKSIPLSL